MTDIHWEALYRAQAVETMPWYWPDLDSDFKRIIEELGIASGRVLDMGTGPGTQAIALAKMGFAVTATDISQTAVDQAAAKAKNQGLDIDFHQDDIVHTKLTGGFDYIFDRGLFHVLPPAERHAYIENVFGLLNPGGYILLKCFSHKETGEGGPYRFSPREIEDLFAGLFTIISIEDSRFSGTDQSFRLALFVVMRRAG